MTDFHHHHAPSLLETGEKLSMGLAGLCGAASIFFWLGWYAAPQLAVANVDGISLWTLSGLAGLACATVGFLLSFRPHPLLAAVGALAIVGAAEVFQSPETQGPGFDLVAGLGGLLLVGVSVHHGLAPWLARRSHKHNF